MDGHDSSQMSDLAHVSSGPLRRSHENPAIDFDNRVQIRGGLLCADRFFAGHRNYLANSHLELNRAHAIWAHEGKHFVSRFKLGTELRLLREVQNMKLPFIVSNDHRSRNTG